MDRDLPRSAIQLQPRQFWFARIELARVDGGRATLPLPELYEGEWVAMDWPYKVAQLVDRLNGAHEFESYFERSGIRKWPA